MYILLNSVTTFIFLIIFDVMDHKAFVRGVLLAVPSSIGVVLGSIFVYSETRKYYPALFTRIINIVFFSRIDPIDR